MVEKFESIYSEMIIRRRFCKRVILFFITFGVSFYISSLLFGSIKVPEIIRLTDLHRCPACYGVSVCPELYTNKIILDHSIKWKQIFNAKNIYYGHTTFKRKVVLKKLAHDSELGEFDRNLCKTWKLQDNCKPKNLLNISANFDEEIINLVTCNLSKPEKGFRCMCPYPYSIIDMLRPITSKNNLVADRMNIWTMLNINPEPIILQIIPKSKGWPVPAFGGTCGRLELVSYEGEPITNMVDQPWINKLKVADQILRAALDFTFKHERYRFYLLDWSLDNIVINDAGIITFVDLEDLVILDKQILPQNDLPDWFKSFSNENIESGYTFSIQNMCKHHLSDHNLWAACFILGGNDNPFLLPIPKEIKATKPEFAILLNNCLHDNDRFKAIKALQDIIFELLTDERFIEFEELKPL